VGYVGRQMAALSFPRNAKKACPARLSGQPRRRKGPAPRPKTSLTMGTFTAMLPMGRFMKLAYWTLILVLLVAAVGVSAVPRADSPQTAFNEADAPVNLAPPCRPDVRLTPPAVDSVSVLPALPTSCARSSMGSFIEPAVTPSRRHPRPLQNLLCTFLI
jgi:hypothetical protein